MPHGNQHAGAGEGEKAHTGPSWGRHVLMRTDTLLRVRKQPATQSVYLPQVRKLMPFRTQKYRINPISHGMAYIPAYLCICFF